MRKCIIFFSVLIIFLPLGAPISWAQEMIFQKGIAKMQVNLPEGKLSIYLPRNIRPGETISGTVIREPAGTKPGQISKNAKALENYRVTMGEQPNPNPNALSVNVPQGSTSVTIRVSDPKNETISQNYLPVLTESASQPAQTNCGVPGQAMEESIVSIPGKFDGLASNTSCTFNHQPLTIMAESGSQCLVKMPGSSVAQKGPIEIKDNGVSGQTPCISNVQLITMQVTTGPLSIQKGTQTYVEVNIKGLNTLRSGDTAGLSIINHSTNVVTMQPRNQLFLDIPGPADSVFNKRFNLVGIQKGDFNVDVNLDLPGNKNEPPANLPQFDLSDLKTKSGYPGSYGLKSDEPCNPEGATMRWQWHKTFQCLIKDRKVLRCGHTKEGDDLYEDIKKLLEELELDKPYETAERMARAFSTAKAFSYSIHVVRPWVDYDIEYVCRGGVWEAVGGTYMRHGTDDLGWHDVKPPGTFCWLTFSDPADVTEFKNAIENALRAACSK